MAFGAIGGAGAFGGAYNVNPAPTGGQGPYGKVPGQIGIPPSLYQQALTSVPGLGQNATTASSQVQSLLQGQVSPDTQAYIERLIAAKGVSTGVEGSPFNTADLVKSLGLTSEQLTISGLGAYNSLLSTIGGLQENPALMSEIGQSNAMLGAAPDPQAAAEKLIADFERYQGGTPDPAGGTHILGPKIPFGGTSYAYPSTSPIGSPDQPSGVFTGGPGFGPQAPPTDPYDAWRQSTFGNIQFGNPSAPYGGGDYTMPGTDAFGLNPWDYPTGYGTADLYGDTGVPASAGITE